MLPLCELSQMVKWMEFFQTLQIRDKLKTLSFVELSHCSAFKLLLSDCMTLSLGVKSHKQESNHVKQKAKLCKKKKERHFVLLLYIQHTFNLVTFQVLK